MTHFRSRKGGLMADVLAVSARQLSYPVALVVLGGSRLIGRSTPLRLPRTT